MNALHLYLLIIPAVCLLAAALLPAAWANRNVGAVRRWVTRVAGLQFAAAVVFTAALWVGEDAVIHVTLFEGHRGVPALASLYYDGISSLAFLLVSFLGWTICRYSVRYLDGQQTQGRYYRWTAFTVGAVSLMSISGNMLVLAVAWLMTGLGLHQLLLHFSQRPEARRAAWTKFVISRLGDAALFGSLALIYSHFRTFELAELFAAVATSGEAAALIHPAVSWATWLLIIAAVTKSAQFPFHTWLPRTMETPTPVSALMHAGIVNAGGYLIIRLAPVASQAPAALAALTVVGAATAGFGAVVMLTQTSVKRSLAYSTIAQMGFMMLQCGLGAFSAAMLHLVAHSLYKAYAFLGSGSVLEQARGSGHAIFPARSLFASWAQSATAVLLVVAVYSGAMLSVGLSPTSKPGGYLLGFVFCLALIHWLRQVLGSDNRSVQLAGVAVAAFLSLAYALSFLAVDAIVSSNPLAVPAPMHVWPVAVAVAFGFVFLFVLHGLVASGRRPEWLNAIYVHASNGFYIDAVWRRIFGSAAST